MSSIERPQAGDAVLGSQTMAANNSVILGGIDGIKTRLNSDTIHAKISALKDAIAYGEAGLQLVLAYLDDRDLRIVEVAFELLESRSEPFVRDRIVRFLDDRELDLQDLKYSLLESSLADFEPHPPQKTKPAKSSNKPKKIKSRDSIRANWHEAS